MFIVRKPAAEIPFIHCLDKLLTIRERISDKMVHLEKSISINVFHSLKINPKLLAECHFCDYCFDFNREPCHISSEKDFYHILPNGKTFGQPKTIIQIVTQVYCGGKVIIRIMIALVEPMSILHPTSLRYPHRQDSTLLFVFNVHIISCQKPQTSSNTSTSSICNISR